ncbi:MAG: hypothetical protein HY702_03355 [Gemmatimonadetes bacterium]|nr:hypothetical protein [Gemmatimonadota bacterium]
MRRLLSLISLLVFVAAFGVACSDPLSPECVNPTASCAATNGDGGAIGSNN